MEPRWTPLASSLLDAVAYDAAGKRLRIRFRSGAVFEYDAVRPVVYDELLAAPSKGGYFSEYIRPDYLYRRVRGAAEGVAVPAR
jgi:hypothetical protein